MNGGAASPARLRIGELRFAASYARRLRSYLRRPPDQDSGSARLERQLAARSATFLSILRRGVFENASSPYRRLFDWAGIAYGDVVAAVGDAGLEGTLERLHDDGVFVAWDEFKGKRPLTRPGLELSVSAADFDNPLGARHYEARTGGSNGFSRRILVDLGLLEHESSYHALFFAAAGAGYRPLGIGHPFRRAPSR